MGEEAIEEKVKTLFERMKTVEEKVFGNGRSGLVEDTAAMKSDLATIKKQNLALADAKEQMQDNGEKLVIRMNNAWAAVETSHKKLQIAHDAIAQAEENLRLNKDYYRVGTTKMTDLLLAQEQYQQARDRYTDAYAALQTKILEYRQATGQQ